MQTSKFDRPLVAVDKSGGLIGVLTLHSMVVLHRPRAVGRKQREWTMRPARFVENRERALPRALLAVVALAPIQHVGLRAFAARQTPALHDRPRTVRLAVLAPFAALQEQARSLAGSALDR